MTSKLSRSVCSLLNTIGSTVIRLPKPLNLLISKMKNTHCSNNRPPVVGVRGHETGCFIRSHCERLGYTGNFSPHEVIMPNSLNRGTESTRAYLSKNLNNMVLYIINISSICMWGDRVCQQHNYTVSCQYTHEQQ